MRPRQFAAIAAGLVLMLAARSNAAPIGPSTDLRDIRVGMPVTDLPNAGYIGFACTGDPGHELPAWSGWRDCPPNADGLRSIRFGFDPATSRDGTVVAGHPVNLTLLVDDAGMVAGLKIDTKTKGPLFVRKKAFLLGLQVKSRYGAEGWTCTEEQPQAGEQPVGGVFLNEKCSKTISDRMIVVQRDLYRRANQDEKSFVNDTQVSIFRVKN